MKDNSKTNRVDKAKKSLADREQFLIITLMITLLIGGYLMFKHKKNAQTLAVATERYEQVKRDLSGFSIAKPIKGSARIEEAKIKKLKDKYTQINELIETAEKDLVDIQNARAVERRWADVSNLISSNALFVVSRSQFEKDIGGVQPYIRGEDQDSILQRPIQTVEIRGRFSDLYSMLNQIKNLEWTLAVLRLELEIIEPSYDPEMKATFILAI